MLKFLLRLLVAVVGFAIGLFCLLLASVGAVRLYGWSQTGRLAPPHFPGLEKFDIISFATDPLRAFMELGGNAFLVVISLSGFVAVILTFRRGVAWWQDWPAVLPMSLVLVFLAAISATLVDRTDWVLPASLLSAFIATGYQWIVLRKQGLPSTARYADEVAAFRQNAPASAQKPSWLGLAAAALMTLLAVMKLVHHVR